MLSNASQEWRLVERGMVIVAYSHRGSSRHSLIFTNLFHSLRESYHRSPRERGLSRSQLNYSSPTPSFRNFSFRVIIGRAALLGARAFLFPPVVQRASPEGPRDEGSVVLHELYCLITFIKKISCQLVNRLASSELHIRNCMADGEVVIKI